MESLKIVAFCIAVAVIYGVAHDEFQARICVECFTRFHPPIFATQPPKLLALEWGVMTTWWAGAIIGLSLAAAARAGSRPKLTFRSVVIWLSLIFATMGLCAVVARAIGYSLAPMPREIADTIPGSMQRRFLADWWAQYASSLSGFVGGLLLCIFAWIKRGRLSA